MSDESKFKEAIDALNRQREASGVNVNGKLYSLVKDRVETFRKTFGSEYGIDTQVDYMNGFATGSVIVCAAKIVDRDGNVLASGHAMERVGSSDVATTAPVEAVETSAIGRALASFGLHGGEYASDAEMTAIPRKQEAAREQKQSAPPPPDMPGFFIPTDVEDFEFMSPEEILSHIENSLNNAETAQDISKYWSALQEYRDLIAKPMPDVHSELKAIFMTRNSQITEQT